MKEYDKQVKKTLRQGMERMRLNVKRETSDVKGAKRKGRQRTALA